MPELTSRSDLYGESNLHVELDEEKLKEVSGGYSADPIRVLYNIVWRFTCESWRVLLCGSAQNSLIK